MLGNKFLAFWGSWLLSGLLFSQEQADLDLYSLSIEELLNTKAIVASGQAELLIEAPGMLSIYPQRDILRYSRFTLGELAEITPGYSRTFQYGEQGFETRGGITSSFNNNRHLVLIDGIQVNHARATKAPAEYELPLIFAKQVEFLRGPASALYGAGAYNGVINIMPETPQNKSPVFINRISFRPLDRDKQAHTSMTLNTGKYRLNIAASHTDKNASQDFVGPTPNEDYLYWDDKKTNFFYSTYELEQGKLKGLGLGAIYLGRQTGLGEHWSKDLSHEINSIKWETVISYLRYRKALNQELSTDIYVKYNRSTEIGWSTIGSREKYLSYSGEARPFFQYNAPVNDWQFHGDLTWKKNLFNIQAGMEWNRQQASPVEDGFSFYYVSADSGEMFPAKANIEDIPAVYYTLSGFVQIKNEFDFLEGLQTTIGLRNDYGWALNNDYNQISPRVGLVQKIIKGLNLKLLYGTALWAPGTKEIGYNRDRLAEHPELKTKVKELDAEEFQTLEAGIVVQRQINLWNIPHVFKTELAVFFNQTDNALVTGPKLLSDSTEIVVYSNSNDVAKAKGGEVEVSLNSEEGISLFANYAYAQVTTSEDKELNDIPEHKMGGGVSYFNKTGPYSALTGYYISGYTGSEEDLGRLLFDANLGWRFTNSLGLETQIKNLFDTRDYFPRNGVAKVPYPERSFTFSVNVIF